MRPAVLPVLSDMEPLMRPVPARQMVEDARFALEVAAEQCAGGVVPQAKVAQALSLLRALVRAQSW